MKYLWMILLLLLVGCQEAPSSGPVGPVRSTPTRDAPTPLTFGPEPVQAAQAALPPAAPVSTFVAPPGDSGPAPPPAYKWGLGKVLLGLSRKPEYAKSELNLFARILAEYGGRDWIKWLTTVPYSPGNTAILINSVDEAAADALCQWEVRLGWGYWQQNGRWYIVDGYGTHRRCDYYRMSEWRLGGEGKHPPGFKLVPWKVQK